MPNYRGPGIYQHYKYGDQYEVLWLAVRERSIGSLEEEFDVLYRAVESDDQRDPLKEHDASFVSRPLEEFDERIDVNGMGEYVPRFERVDTYDIEVVALNHLEAMGIGMALAKEEQTDGLSEPQRWAQKKIQRAIGVLMRKLGIG